VTLRSHPELEAQLVATPDDDGIWQVYEDWLIDQQDPRAAIIVCERARDLDGVDRARLALFDQLFGPRASMLVPQLVSHATWRGGYVRQCRIDASSPGCRDFLATFLESLPARVLTRLELVLFDHALLGELRRARSLRSLHVRAAPLYTTFDATLLEAPPHLVELKVSPVVDVIPASWLGRLRTLELVSAGDFELGTLTTLGLTSLERLMLDVEKGVLRTRSIALAETLPALRELSMTVRRPRAEHALQILLSSGILTRLERLRFSGIVRTLTAEERRQFRGGVLSHMDDVQLPGGMFVKV
jgi:uncharacterized protein (TIGR02996 family)